MAARSAAIALLWLLAACDSAPEVQAAEHTILAPAAQTSAKEPSILQQAIFAGGCFWGVEAVFSHVQGVKSAVSGYHGGQAQSATYEKVGMGTTGHAEAVRVIYDPAQVHYEDLLRIFFSVVIDPTQADGQGPDHGPQYRAALVPMNAEQQRVASAYLAQLRYSRLWSAPIATGIEPYRAFYAAEAEHQDFMLNNPRHPYITYWDVPKVAALKKLFPENHKPDFTRR